MSKRKNIEERLQISISHYIQVQYPKVIFTSESSGVRVNMGTAIKMKKQRSKHKLPDLMIFESNSIYKGLFIELKKDFNEIHKKDGSYRQTEHILKQLETLKLLNKQGYLALFGCGFDETKRIIDDYLSIIKTK
jgi:hypothetical protein